MNLRTSSILVTFLLFAASAQPAFAKKGKDKEKASKDESSEAADEAKGEEGEGGGESAEAVAEPDPWEHPPADEEKPPAEKPQAPKEEPVGDGNNIEIGALLGYGFKTDRRTCDSCYGADPYGLAAGLSGGYTLDVQVYVGAYFIYFLGSSQEGGNQGTIISGESSANYMNFGAEVGYDAWFSDILLRPSLQLGVGLALSELDGNTDSVGDLALGPGLRVLIPLGDLFIGGDLRGHVVTGNGTSALGLYFTIGHRMK